MDLRRGSPPAAWSYGLRAPFSQERFSLAGDGRVIYQLSRPWPDSAGVRELVLEGRELLSRLAALVPAPYLNLTRYHGVFASRSKWRSRLPAPAERGATGERSTGLSSPVSASPESTPGGAVGSGGSGAPEASPSPRSCRRRWMPWSVLLARVFYLEALTCVKCGGKRKVLAFLTDPLVVRKILSHLGLETAPLPLAPARLGERDGRLWSWEAGGEEWDVREIGSEAAAGAEPSGSANGDTERGPP